MTKTPPRRRAQVARLERPLLAGGLALVVFHLLDLTFSGSHTRHRSPGSSRSRASCGRRGWRSASSSA